MADLDTAIDSYLGDRRQQAVEGLKLSVSNALTVNPDQEAEARRAATALQIPVDTARDNLDEARQRARMEQTDFGMLSERFPKTANYLTQQDNANLSHDDVDSLSGIERLLNPPAPSLQQLHGVVGPAVDFAKRTGKNIAAGMGPGLSEGVWGGVRMAADMLPYDWGAPVAEYAGEQGVISRGIKEAWTGKGDSLLGSSWDSGMQSLGQNLALLPLGLLGKIGPMLNVMGGITAGQSYGNAVDKGVNKGVAATYATLQGLIEKHTEMIGMPALFGMLKPGQFSAKALEYLVKEQGGEQIATALQDLNDWVVLPENKDKTFGDYLSERPDAALQTALATAFGGGGQVALMKGVQQIIIYGDAKAQQAEATAAFINDLNTLATASNTLRRDAGSFEQFVAAAAEEGQVQQVFIDANTLMQSGVAEQVASVSPSVAAQLSTAAQTGGQIAIPVEEYAAKIAPAPFAQSLLDHLKTDPDGFSRAEAQEYMQSDRAQELETLVERTLTEAQQSTEFKQSAEAVHAQIKAELDQAGRWTGQVNDAYAALVSKRFAVFAAQLGVTPEEVYSRYKLHVASTAPDGQKFDQLEGDIVPGGQMNWYDGNDPAVRELYDLWNTELKDGQAEKISGEYGYDVPAETPRDRAFNAADIADLREEAAGIEAPERGITFQITDEGLAVLRGPAGKRVPARFQRFAEKHGLTLSVRRNRHWVNGYGSAMPLMYRRGGALYFGESYDEQGFLDRTGKTYFQPNGTLIAPVATITGEEIAPLTADTKTLRTAAKAWYKEHLRDQTETNEKSGRTVKFADPRKSFHISADPNKLRMFAALREIVRKGTIHTSKPPVDQAAEPSTKAYHWLTAWVNFDGRPVEVGVTLREDQAGHLYYNHSLLENGAVKPSTRSGPANKAGAGEGGNTALEQSIVGEPDGINLFVLGQDTGTARGSFNPATNTIALLQKADLSTFLHESGHFFLETQFDIAAQLYKDEEIFGRESLKPGERQIIDDTSAILKWFGIGSLDEWTALDFEEKRSYHEKFARGFEAYLFEGNAPSIEMQGLFQRFRAWLLNVYRDLKALNVELNDEVRGVFDRMLATTEEIQLAEQGRSMLPLFETAEQAGMTVEEFAAYQALGLDATNEAIQDLQAKGLRDMAWMHNFRGREVKRLQKEADARRTEIRMAVRREVMSQPIYQAWSFLTRKITAEDKLPKVETAKGSPDTLNPDTDSLFVAIAKLGGIQRESARVDLGVHKDTKIPMAAFGKPVLRREGGLTVDQMADSLFAEGYLSAHDLREFEEKFHNELGGQPQYSVAYDYAANDYFRAGDQVANPDALGAGRFDLAELNLLGLPVEVVNAIKARKMTASNGLHPDIVADLFGFTSGDELARKLAEVTAPNEEIEALTDVRMLEEFGELSSPEAIARSADKAIHNEVRARFIATEANALAKAAGQRSVLAPAAKAFATAMINRLRVRDVRPSQYTNAEARAAKASDKARRAGDMATAAAEKRNQLVQNYAARAAHLAREGVEKGLRYLNKFNGDVKGLDPAYRDQIDTLLERFDLRKGTSNKAVDKRTALAEWLKSQRDAGFEPDIPPQLENEAYRVSYKNMTVEEFAGLVDTVKQIEHLGRLKDRLLTAADQRAYEAVRDEMAASINKNAQGREADTRTPTTSMGRALKGLKRFWASHIKAATWARIMDGGKDGGPVWEYLVHPANNAGDMESTMRAEATHKLAAILAPVFALGKMGGSGQYFESINRSLNREARLTIALNIGNEGNLQRLLGGEGWTAQQLLPVLDTLTAEEWAAVQAIWDHFEEYRPLIAAKERRVYGKEPDWVQHGSPLTDKYNLRGGYYPIKYDTAASQRAEEHADAEGAKRQLQGAYTSATTRRSFTKSRVDEVNGRPLLYTLSGLYAGVNDVIHDLAWHEWLIDANRLLRSQTIDQAIRLHYGPEVKQQLKTWAGDNAEGDKGVNSGGAIFSAFMRRNVSLVGLGFNVVSAAIQPLGLTQSIVRVGAPWIGRGVAKYIAHPIDLTRQVNSMSEFMANRTRTRFRELAELRDRVEDQSRVKELMGAYGYFLMMRCQQAVDVPTWWGAYEKAIAEGNDESRAVALADQAVIDSQGSGQTKDLSAIERGNPAEKLLTVFYSFFNTALNIGVERTMGADTPAKKARLAVDFLLLYTVPAVLSHMLRSSLTPGDAGDDDPEELAKKLIAAQIDYLMGLMVGVREFAEAAKMLAGANDFGRPYAGPAGMRLVSDTVNLAAQAHQGEFDTAFRKALVNTVSDLFGLPGAQINRTITGVEALSSGKTENPAAIFFGFREHR